MALKLLAVDEGETLEHAQTRTAQFVALVRAEVAALGLAADAEPFIAMAEKIAAALTEPAEHYELREQLAGAYSAAAYKHLVELWKATPDV